MLRICHFSIEEIRLLFQYLDEQIMELKNLLGIPEQKRQNDKDRKNYSLEDVTTLIEYLDDTIRKLHNELNSDFNGEMSRKRKLSF